MRGSWECILKMITCIN
ncbi:hypothetical protein F383_26091 [Gossypium arboreum]|uniref:Uncharacterized protein n=1 Tax=Gossypium arboreum TaxID=29729 RepID=A0A0B0P7Z3_GOSAR|nr:hypothetical protein F383_26091 [Gossypium arboreum]